MEITLTSNHKKLSNIHVASICLDHWKEFIHVTLDRVYQLPGIPDKWAIRDSGCCLNKDGEWEYEPIPSSRDDDFMRRCRFSTMDEALSIYILKDVKSRFEHYREADE